VPIVRPLIKEDGRFGEKLVFAGLCINTDARELGTATNDVDQVHGQYTLLHLASTILDKALPFRHPFTPMRSTMVWTHGPTRTTILDENGTQFGGPSLQAFGLPVQGVIAVMM
jgi:hypothetical protein